MGEVISMEQAEKFAEVMRNVDWTDPAQRKAIAQVIIQKLNDEMAKDNLIRLFVSEESFRDGDTMQFITRKGAQAYVHAPGSAAPRSTITQAVTPLEAEQVSVMLEFEISQLENGRYGSVNEIRKMAQEALIAKKYQMVWDTLRGSVAATDAGYQTADDVGTTASKKSALDAVIKHCEDKPGGIAAIVARRPDLDWLLDYTTTNGMNYSDAMKDQIIKTGAVGVYRGYPVVAINGYEDAYGVDMITSGDIMVVNKESIKLGVTRAVKALEGMNISAGIWEIRFWEKYGVGAFFPERNGKLTIT